MNITALYDLYHVNGQMTNLLDSSRMPFAAAGAKQAMKGLFMSLHKQPGIKNQGEYNSPALLQVTRDAASRGGEGGIRTRDTL